MDSETISKKSQQLRLYFAKTARDMILQSGMEAVSIRAIAKQAGYAYGTIYNHFANLDELLWLTRDLLMADIGDYIEQKADGGAVTCSADVAALFGVYAEYFIKHPSVYRFLYFYPLSRNAKHAPGYIETDAYREKFSKTFAYLSARMEPQDIQNAVKTILYSIHGLLTLSISKNDDLGIENVQDEIGEIVRYLLGGS